MQVKNDFAENLSNIAHQIKTPSTAISLAVQRMKQGVDCADPEQAKTRHAPKRKEGLTVWEQKETENRKSKLCIAIVRTEWYNTT